MKTLTIIIFSIILFSVPLVYGEIHPILSSSTDTTIASPPVYTGNLYLSMNEGETQTFNALHYVTDPDGDIDPSTLEIFTDYKFRGTVEIRADNIGRVIYTAPTELTCELFSESQTVCNNYWDTITFTVKDSTGLESNIGYAYFKIKGASIALPEPEPEIISIIVNDTISIGDSVTVTITSETAIDLEQRVLELESRFDRLKVCLNE